MTISQQPEDDQRQYIRIPKQVSVDITTLTFPLPTQSEGTCETKNISCSGVCICGKKPFKKGTIVSLHIKIMGWQSYKKPFSKIMDISNEPPLTAIGEVVWCKKIVGRDEFDIGIKFVNLYEDDRIALTNYLKHIEKQIQ